MLVLHNNLLTGYKLVMLPHNAFEIEIRNEIYMKDLIFVIPKRH